jgi:hypothetical protein
VRGRPLSPVTLVSSKLKSESASKSPVESNSYIYSFLHF